MSTEFSSWPGDERLDYESAIYTTRRTLQHIWFRTSHDVISSVVQELRGINLGDLCLEHLFDTEFRQFIRKLNTWVSHYFRLWKDNA